MRRKPPPPVSAAQAKREADEGVELALQHRFRDRAVDGRLELRDVAREQRERPLAREAPPPRLIGRGDGAAFVGELARRHGLPLAPRALARRPDGVLVVVAHRVVKRLLEHRPAERPVETPRALASAAGPLSEPPRALELERPTTSPADAASTAPRAPTNRRAGRSEPLAVSAPGRTSTLVRTPASTVGAGADFGTLQRCDERSNLRDRRSRGAARRAAASSTERRRARRAAASSTSGGARRPGVRPTRRPDVPRGAARWRRLSRGAGTGAHEPRREGRHRPRRHEGPRDRTPDEARRRDGREGAGRPCGVRREGRDRRPWGARCEGARTGARQAPRRAGPQLSRGRRPPARRPRRAPRSPASGRPPGARGSR
jgi:hypothetical protein